MITNSDTNLPSVQENEFLPSIGRWTIFGGLFILFVLGLSIPVAAVVKYKVTVKAKAVVRPAGELRIVQAATEGQVTQIHVKTNQTVKQGDKIASIEDSRLQTKKSQLLSNIQQARLQLVHTNAQINTLNNQIKAEIDRINRTIASAQAELRGSKRAYQDKKITAVAQIREANANVNIAKEELHVGQSQLKSAQANFLSAKAAMNAAKAKWNRYQTVEKQAKGALSFNLLDETQLAVEQQEQAMEAQKTAIEIQKQTIEKLKQAVRAAIARRSRAEAALNPSNAEVAIATERIAQEKAAGEANKANLEKERQTILKQRIEIEKQIERDNSELNQIEKDLSKNTITATEDGIISKLNLRNSGQIVRAGEVIVKIIPINAPKIIKAAVGSEDKGKLEVGQKVQMRVKSCPYPNYGTLKGKLTTIAPDTTVSPQNDSATNETNTTSKITAPGAFYEVIIEPEKLALGRPNQKECKIQFGMHGRADIITREETVLQFFLRKARLITDL